MNAVCVGLTTECVTSEILLVPTLVKILKLTLRRQMGRYYCICVAFSFLVEELLCQSLGEKVEDRLFGTP
jgi:hypothetical protein